jgi:hypothetical protein|tara:strand:- start:9884 stop:11545 length:1662 start_codon:yes stop_codon:yes gene_type:complete
MTEQTALQVSNPSLSVAEQNIEINAIGGNAFKPGDRVEIHIPATIGFINPAESYLTFEVEHSGEVFTMCNALSGGHGYIDQLYIRSLNSGETLESIDSYNFLVANTLWRNRHKDDHRNLQDLATGCEDADFSAGAYYISNNNQNFYLLDNAKTRAGGQITAQKVKMNLNLLSGVLGNLGRNTMCPVVALGGLNIQLNLAPVLQSAFPLSSVVQTTATTPTRTIGDLVTMKTNYGDNFIQSGTEWSKIEFSSFKGSASDYDELSVFPLKVGQVITVHYKKGGVAQASVETSVKALTRKATTFETVLELNTPITLVDADVITDVNVEGHTTGNSLPDWTISNVKMVCQVIAPSSQQLAQFNKGVSEGAGKTWRYYSVTNYKQVLNSSQLQASLRIPTINTRCVSLLSVPQDLAEVDNNQEYGFTANGEDGEKEYQYLLKTRLVPDRRVPCARGDQTLKNGKYKLWQREVEKSLNVAGIKCERLDGSTINSASANTPSAFCIGRAVGSLKATSMLANTEPTLNINYSAKSKNQLYHNFVFHTRRAGFSKRGLVVDY